jgi:hypothetical protein
VRAKSDFFNSLGYKPECQEVNKHGESTPGSGLRHFSDRDRQCKQW